MTDTSPIDYFFEGPYAFLDNFYPHRQWWAADGLWVPTVEHAYQASKTLEPRQRMAIATANTPGKAKALGQRCPLRPDWEVIKVQVMRELLLEKFKPGTTLRDRLLETRGRALIEGNTWGDREWGQDPVGVGKNYLGRLLMEIRGDGPRVEVESSVSAPSFPARG